MRKLGIGLLTSALMLSSCFQAAGESSREKADRLAQEKRYDEAVAEYWRHIDKRLAVADRPAWENPYLYLLDIGDVYLEQGNVAEALRHYEMAEEKGVKQGYVNDRYRHVASWYEARGELKKALEHLERYRDKDPLLIDLMLDRMARQLVQEQDQKTAVDNGTAPPSEAARQEHKP